MSDARRTVRATASFFEDVDRQFPAERGPNGEPSANDFEVFELLRIVETFATRFDELPELIPGRHDYRILISQGMLVPRFAVVGQLAPDGAVELISSMSIWTPRADAMGGSRSWDSSRALPEAPPQTKSRPNVDHGARSTCSASTPS